MLIEKAHWAREINEREQSSGRPRVLWSDGFSRSYFLPSHFTPQLGGINKNMFSNVHNPKPYYYLKTNKEHLPTNEIVDVLSSLKSIEYSGGRRVSLLSFLSANVSVVSERL